MSFFTAWCFPFWPSPSCPIGSTNRKLRYALAAGFCFGLVFLTKPEIFVALAAGVVAAFVLFQRHARAEGALRQIGGGVSGGRRDSGCWDFSFISCSVEDWRDEFVFHCLRLGAAVADAGCPGSFLSVVHRTRHARFSSPPNGHPLFLRRAVGGVVRETVPARDGFGRKTNHPTGADDSVAGRRRLVQLAQLRRITAVAGVGGLCLFCLWQAITQNLSVTGK